MNTICPYCKYNATDHETLNDEKNPEEGDLSVCINCCEVSQFNDGKLTQCDLSTLLEETRLEIEKIKDAWLQTRHMRKTYRDSHEQA